MAKHLRDFLRDISENNLKFRFGVASALAKLLQIFCLHEEFGRKGTVYLFAAGCQTKVEARHGKAFEGLLKRYFGE